MRRRTFDRLVSTEGLVLVPVLAVAGGLLTWAQRYIVGEVRDQLAAQKIYFPATDSPELAAPEFEPVRQYAGQQLTTGDQAKAYADHYIASHLKAWAPARATPSCPPRPWPGLTTLSWQPKYS